MSQYYDYDSYPDGKPPGPGTTVSATINLLLVVALVGVIVSGAFLFPTLARLWMEQDLEYKLRDREVSARAEAEQLYRKREAEMAAEAKAMAERLAKTEIAPSTFRAVYSKVGPAVVSIRTYTLSNRENGAPIRRGEGSGVIVRVTPEKMAYVLTNSHVLLVPTLNGRYNIADRIAITLQSGRTILVSQGEFVYTDPQMDLAVVRFDASTLDHIVSTEFAPPGEVQVGDWVMAIGSPFGLAQTVTTGVVSAKGRSTVLLDGMEMIQTDAAINPGNSGGPLLDMKGRIVGINTFIVSESGGNEGIGFAIPGETAKDVFEQLLKPPHRLSRGYLGINALDLNPDKAAEFRVPGGAVVELVQPNSPGDKAGLRERDIIIKFKDKPVRSFNELRGMIMASKPEEMVVMEIIRLRGREIGPMRISAKLSERPPLRADENIAPPRFPRR